MLSPLLEEIAVDGKPRKRYVAVGTGERISMFIDPLVSEYAADGELVGLCDLSQTRMNYHQQRLINQYGYDCVPTYAAADFGRMLSEVQPDIVIVCTMDATHHEYIVRALHAGCDVITEKPMTTDAEKCRAIFQAVEETGRSVRVAFNCRWAPGPAKVRELIASGAIGSVKAVNLEYQLNTSHGADYFRRWHATKSSSGGLLVHKSTHHFDMVNWWLNAIPEEVFAYGGLKFYGRANALQRGDAHYTGYERYSGVPEAQTDPFALSLEGSGKSLYADAEAESGYIRDRNVFREDIDIEDTMSVLVRYRTGEQLNYSLVAYSPQEGYRVTFTGDKGRIEYTETHASHILGEEPAAHEIMHLRLIPHFKPGIDVPIPALDGSHGGSDPLLQEQIFSALAPQDFLCRTAGHEQGAASLLIGAAANRSMATGLPVRIDDLCPLPGVARKLSELV